jgi:hypothetical protein
VTSEPAWEKSVHCSNGTCVEVADAGATVLVRDSKNTDQPYLRVPRQSWTEFAAGMLAGEFADL